MASDLDSICRHDGRSCSRSHAAVTSRGWLRLLHPDAVLRVDTGGTGPKLVRGAAEVARQATMYRAAGLGRGPRWSTAAPVSHPRSTVG